METTTALTRDEEARLVKVAARLRKDAADFTLAGLGEKAERVRDELAQVTARLSAAKAARQDAERDRWAAQDRQEQELERAEREREEARTAAVEFLTSLFAGGRSVEVGVVFDAAAQAGISDAALLYAAGRLGLRRMGWPRSGTATIHDRARGTYWGIRTPFGGMVDIGPPTADVS